MPLFLIAIVEGFLVKSVASLNDTLTQIPVIATVTRTLKGKFAFSLGNLLALSLIIIISVSFSAALERVSFSKWIVAGLIMATAAFVYFDFLEVKRREFSVRKLEKLGEITSARFIRLIGVGFLVSFITLIDDAIILTSLFVGDGSRVFYMVGILASAILQIFIVIYLGHKISALRFKKEISVLAMVTLAVLVALGIV